MGKVAEIKAEVKKNTRPQASTRLTSEQWEAFTFGLTASGKSHVQFVQHAIRLACKEYGIDFPLNMPRAGKYERNKVNVKE